MIIFFIILNKKVLTNPFPDTKYLYATFHESFTHLYYFYTGSFVEDIYTVNHLFNHKIVMIYDNERLFLKPNERVTHVITYGDTFPYYFYFLSLPPLRIPPLSSSHLFASSLRRHDVTIRVINRRKVTKRTLYLVSRVFFY